MASPGANSNPFAAPSADPFSASNPFGTASAVDTSYAPPNTGTWQRQAMDEEDEPFSTAHLAAAQNAAPVPAVPAARPLPPPQHTTLTFTESTLPTTNVTGRIDAPQPLPAAGQASPVPRVGSAPNAALLAGLPSSSGGAPAAAPEDPSRYSFYHIKRYRGLFNVDTGDVLQRIFHAVALFFRGDFLEFVGANPDLYGPFWVASTLIFVTAATGNYASYIDWRHHSATGEGPEHAGGWYYDVDKVGASIGLFYGYVGVVGLALWGILKWFKAGVALASVWCTYGYSLAVFIPISFACVFPVEIMRWALVGAATLTSGTFIMLSLHKPIHEAAGAKAAPLYLVMIALHAGLGLATKLYFFRYKDIKA